MSSLFIVLAVVILAFFAYSIKLWFDYKKVAVQSKGYAKTSGIYFLLLAFMALTGILSLSDKLLNLLLTKIGIPALDLSQHTEYKWMMFAAFIVFAIAVVLILKKQTKAVVNNAQQASGEMSGTFNGNVKITNIQNNSSNKHPPANEKVSDHLIAESQRKNKEIDRLKEQLENSLSDEERIHLSTKINRLKAELKAYEQEIKILKEQLEKYSLDIQIVKNTNGLLKRDGIDVALDYLESINFKNTLKVSQQHAKALLIKAGFYVVKNQHEKADKAFLQSIQLHRDFDNTTAYANYLLNQNKIIESIKQLLVLNIESKTLAEDEKATVLRNLADAYRKNNQYKEAEKVYDEALRIYRALWRENPSGYLPYVAATLNNLAVLYSLDNRLEDAEKAFDETLGVRRSLSKENSSAYLPYVAATLNNLGILYRSDNRLNASEKAYNEALGIYRALWKKSPSAYLPSVARTLNNLAILYRSDNRLKEAEKALDEALGIRRTLSKENPSAYLPDVATTLNNLAVLYGSNNRLEESERAYDEALGIRRSLAKESPSAYLPNVAETLNNLATFYYSDKRLEEAENAYNEALDIYKPLSKKNPNAYGIDLANTLVMGVDLINQPRASLKEAREILLKFKGIPRADNLLLIIDENS